MKCAVCGSPNWIAVSPGTSDRASRFVGDQVAELHDADAQETRAWCLEHWRQSWSAVPAKPVEGEDEAIGQADLFVVDRIAQARAALSAEITDEPYR